MGLGVCLGCIILGIVGGVAIGGYVVVRYADKAIKEQGRNLERVNAYYEILNEWVKGLHEGKSIESYFVENEYKTVAIYGYAELGKRLYEELNTTKVVEVKYLIDKNANIMDGNVAAYRPDQEFPEVDVIVVTPVTAHIEIEKMLMKKVGYKIVSLYDVIWEMD